MRALDDLTGRRFGMLVVKELAGRSPAGAIVWRCQCDCGAISKTLAGKLRSGHTRSCGCLRAETTIDTHRTHGMTGTPTYNSWQRMLARCFNPNTVRFESWGGRGITVCDAWRSFENFFADMGKCPPGMSLDRYPNRDGNYELENCRWATPTEQSTNRKTTRWITLCGEEMSLKAACGQFGLDDRMVHKLARRSGITLTEAFFNRMEEKHDGLLA